MISELTGDTNKEPAELDKITPKMNDKHREELECLKLYHAYCQVIVQ